MSPGSEDEATEMETGAPHPAVTEMGKARFSISTGWERGRSGSSRSRGRSGMRLLDLHRDLPAQLCPCSILMCPFPRYPGWGGSQYLYHIYLAFQS